MPAPKIKFHQLHEGYTEESDTDVRRQDGDELIPCTDKNPLLEAAVLLQGIFPADETECFPIDLTLGRIDPPFSMTFNGNYWEPSGITMGELVVGPTGFYGHEVRDVSGNVVAPTGYVVVYSGANPVGFQFIGTTPNTPKLSRKRCSPFAPAIRRKRQRGRYG